MLLEELTELHSTLRSGRTKLNLSVAFTAFLKYLTKPASSTVTDAGFFLVSFAM